MVVFFRAGLKRWAGCRTQTPLFHLHHKRFIQSTAPGHVTFSTKQAGDLMRKARYRKVVDTLSADSRVKIPAIEYQTICSEIGLSAEESTNLRKSLNETGVIWQPPAVGGAGAGGPGSDFDHILTKPHLVAEALMRSLDLGGSHTDKFVAEQKAILRQLQAELKPLEEEHAKLHLKAERYAGRCIKAGVLGIMLMSMAIVRLTFWDLSWDIMEPVTYMINLITMTSGVAFFALYRNEYSYESLFSRIVHSRESKYHRRGQLDVAKMEHLRQAIAEAQQKIKHPDQMFLQSIQAKCAPVPVKIIPGKESKADAPNTPKANTVAISACAQPGANIFSG
eukprot:520033_1